MIERPTFKLRALKRCCQMCRTMLTRTSGHWSSGTHVTVVTSYTPRLIRIPFAYASRFKLHLRPQSILPGATLPPIGVDKPIVEILSDYLGYVFKCAKAFISETNPIGRQILSSSTPIDFVLSHPNGWLGPQQNSMRRAAILADLIPDNDEGASRLQFVTEGEASLQFCVATGLGEDVIQVSILLC